METVEKLRHFTSVFSNEWADLEMTQLAHISNSARDLGYEIPESLENMFKVLEALNSTGLVLVMEDPITHTLKVKLNGNW